MKTKPLTFLLAITFVFIFPFVSHSTTFKCEFVAEKFKGGKTNVGTCSGDPEIVFGTKQYPAKRSLHCSNKTPVSYDDYIDYVVDLDKRLITYTNKRQNTEVGLAMMMEHISESTFENKEDYELYIETLKAVKEYKFSEKILTIQSFNQTFDGSGKSLVITYKHITALSRPDRPEEIFYSLYIPPNGKSILTKYITQPLDSTASWVNHKFGKCVNTSS